MGFGAPALTYVTPCAHFTALRDASRFTEPRSHATDDDGLGSACLYRSASSLANFAAAHPEHRRYSAAGWQSSKLSMFKAIPAELKILVGFNWGNVQAVPSHCFRSRHVDTRGTQAIGSSRRWHPVFHGGSLAAVQPKMRLQRLVCGGSSPPATLMRWFLAPWSISLFQTIRVMRWFPLVAYIRRCLMVNVGHVMSHLLYLLTLMCGFVSWR